VAAVALFALGCGGRTDVAVLEAMNAESDAGPEGGTCGATLSVGSVTVTPGCWIDEKVSNRSAMLQWPCDAGGPAEAVFGVPFAGTVAAPSGFVSLSAQTTFPWSDGCTWESVQTIDGVLGSGVLQYNYSEMHIQGTGCAPEICHGSASVVVE
jgi:hypothetical protein